MIDELIVYPSAEAARQKQRELKAKGHLGIVCVSPHMNNVRGLRARRVTVVNEGFLRSREGISAWAELYEYLRYFVLSPEGVMVD